MQQTNRQQHKLYRKLGAHMVFVVGMGRDGKRNDVFVCETMKTKEFRAFENGVKISHKFLPKFLNIYHWWETSKAR